jgi:hypothetical protein
MGLTLLGLWHLVALPWAERQLEAASGYRTVIGSLSLWSGGLRARDVTVFGAAPFASAALARIAELKIGLGGPGHPRFRPSSVSASGVQITYLRTGRVDNLRGADARPATAHPRSGPPLRLMLREGRLEAFIRVAPGLSLVARGANLRADRTGTGPLTAELEGLSVDAPGLLTLAAPRLTVTSQGGRRSVTGQGMRIVLPGGGTLLEQLELTGELGAEAATLAVRSLHVWSCEAARRTPRWTSPACSLQPCARRCTTWASRPGAPRLV